MYLRHGNIVLCKCCGDHTFLRDHYRAMLQHSRHYNECIPAQNKQNHEECTPHIRMGRAPVVSGAASASRAESAAALVLAVIVEACADHARRAAHHLW